MLCLLHHYYVSLCVYQNGMCLQHINNNNRKKSKRHGTEDSFYLGASHDGDLLAISRASPATASATWRDVLNYNIGDAKTLVFRGEIRPHEHC